jgi:hypothetical protein
VGARNTFAASGNTRSCTEDPLIRADSKWHLLYCDREIPHCPVTEFIDSSPPNHQVKILRFLGLLEELGPALPRPYADILQDGIHELRIRLSGDQIRMLYFFCYQKYIILYYPFVKNTNRVPEEFIRKVALYRNSLLRRYSPQALEEQIFAKC